jgi:hypothetical protein
LSVIVGARGALLISAGAAVALLGQQAAGWVLGIARPIG